MSSGPIAPSLPGVLIALNLALALVWIPIIDSFEDPTNLLHVVLLVNGTASAWWFWSDARVTDKPLEAATSSDDALKMSMSCSGEENIGGWTSTLPTTPMHQTRSRSGTTPPASSNPSTDHLSTFQQSSTSTLPHTLPAFPSGEVKEDAQLHHTIHILTKERDMYRSRAYQLAARLDDSYTAHAHTECALKHAQDAAAEAQRALHVLEAERRDLSVAMAAARAEMEATAPQLQSSELAGPAVTHERDASNASEDIVLYPHTPIKRACADERPLLLPPTAETTEDTPTRSRLSTWTSGIRSQSRLHEIVLSTRRRAEAVAQVQQKGAGAACETPVRPVISVVHVQDENKNERAGAKEEKEKDVEVPLTKEQKEAERIIEDLQMSRGRTSPVLGQEHTDDQQRASVQVKRQSFDGSKQARRRSSTDTLAVPIQVLRQPRGPPPSPLASLLDKAASKTSEHTWRGRGRIDSDAAPTASTASTLYPTSRMPRARQATAPPASTAASHSTTSNAAIAPMMIYQSNVFAVAPKATVTPAVGTIGGERKRHATFSGASTAVGGGSAPGSGRWQMSAFARGAIGVERLRAAASQQVAFAPGTSSQVAGTVF